MKVINPESWDAEDCWEPITASPSLHAVSGEIAVKVTRQRPIGFNANVCLKPIYRVPARGKKV